MQKNIIKLENILLFFVGIILFHNFSNNWLLFVLLLFTPDISILGYLISKKVGFITYNLTHNYALAFLLLAIGFLTSQNVFLILGSILTSHVGLDRAIGYGLKYPNDFKKTHIQKL